MLDGRSNAVLIEAVGEMDLDEEVRNCQQVLKSGGLILYPTDTIWGIGCDSRNEAAVSKVFALKKRKAEMSMLVLASDEAMVDRYFQEVPDAAWDLFEHAVKPTTLVLSHAGFVANNLLASDGSLGVRVVKDVFCKKLIRRLNRPLVSTSANVSGVSTAINFSDIDPSIKSGVDYIVNHRRTENIKAQPSSIIKLDPSGKITFIRK